MKRNMVAALFATLSILPPAALAKDQPTPELQALDDALPGDLINNPAQLDWVIFGANQSSKTIKGAKVEGGAAVQIVISAKGAKPYDTGANVPIGSAIRNGRDYVAAFYARTISADTPDGNAVVTGRFQMNAAPYDGFGDKTFSIGKEWKLYEFTGRATRDITKQLAVVGFQLAGAKQTIEVGQTYVVENATTLMARTAAAPAEPDPTLPPQLVGKGTLINDVTKRDWNINGAQTSKPTVTNVYGRVGTQITVPAAGKNPWDAGLSVEIPDNLAANETILVAILARTLSADTTDKQGNVTVRIQGNSAPYDGFGDKALVIAPTWRLYQMRFTIPKAMPKGTAQLALHLAGVKQDLEFGPIYMIRETTPATAPR